MRRFDRTNPPDFLQKNAKKWGEDYAKNKKAKPKYVFQWKTFQKRRVNQHIEPLLKKMTGDHCSYCDHFPPQRSDDTIDHFCPKGDARFYHLAYEWTNLYSGCADCQGEKLNQYDDALLRPDADDYTFERYFVYNYAEHKIEVYPDADPEDQRKAEITLEIFGLNDRKGIKTSRRHAMERFLGMKKEEINLIDFPYRFMFEPLM